MLDTPVSDFELPATGPTPFRLSAQRGKTVVLYFYPKDSTPGCTTEAQQFRDLHADFLAAGCVLAGVSRDSLRSHENFKTKQALPFELISDTDETLCQRFGVIKEKKLYGKLVRGIERSTFVIDAHGILRREWRGIKVPGHAQGVLDYVRTL
ncbi:MAG: peroxiredoxin [Propionivibrio sp.]